DGTTAEGTMHLGVDVSDWWVGVLPVEDRLIWTGTNPVAMAKGNDIGIYRMRWDNPRPDDKIVSLDLVAPNRLGAPFIVAITAESK
ncbi:MAG TPA: hypothetical protein VFG14_13345, partial [Chthoniobacteraceae bacterium]|nr:hypothetical protein [Chthoniobacteraceae bacterium]